MSSRGGPARDRWGVRLDAGDRSSITTLTIGKRNAISVAIADLDGMNGLGGTLEPSDLSAC